MSRGLLLILFFVLANNAFAQITKQKQPQFTEEIKQLATILHLPGFSLAVVKNGKIIHRQMGGYSNIEKKIPVKDDDLFMIASVTKTFSANILMQYEQERLASVEDNILNYRYIDLNNGWPYNIDANTTVRNFMSHTSEDGPGAGFVYNGSRFNFMYGVFEKAGGYSKNQDAFTREVQKRILTPLGMVHTISGFPASRTDTMFRHIATPYMYNRDTRKLTEDTINYVRWTRSLPSGGLLSTIGDMVAYSNSYDTHRLVTESSYQKMTTPTKLNDGSTSPYGIGWFTESFAGKKIHWHYGQADSYAALFIRVPETGYTFIFLANSNAPSEALRLGAGMIVQSPFANAFLKNYVFATDVAAQQKLAVEDSIGHALFFRYTEKITGEYSGEAERWVSGLAAKHPQRFAQYDPGLTFLLTDMQVASFAPLMDKLADGYRRYGHVQPYVSADFADYYLRAGKQQQALEFYRGLAGAKGFETWQLAADAALTTGRILFSQGKIAEGRTWYWKAINDLKLQWADDEVIRKIIEEMNRGGVVK